MSILKNKYQLLLLAIGVGLIGFGCNAKNQNHPTEINKISKAVADMFNDGHTSQIPRYLDSAYAHIQNPGDSDLWVKYSHRLNLYIFYEINTQKARSNLDSMFLILKNKERIYPMEYANTLYSEGDLNIAEKQYNKAFKSYYDGRSFVQKYLDSCDYGRFSSKLAIVQYNQSKYLEAIPHLKQAITEYANCKPGTKNDFENLFLLPQSNLNTIALCFEKAMQLDSAIYYYQKALLFVKHTALKFPDDKQFAASAIGVINGNLGGTYAKKGNFSLAEHYLKESIHINDQAGHAKDDVPTAKIKLVRLYLDFNRLSEAKELLKEISTDQKLGLGTNIQGENIRLQWQELKWKYENKTGNIAAAFLHIQRYYRLRDSINRVNAGLEKADIDAGIQEAGHRYQIQLLNKDNQLKTVYLSTAVVFSLLSIAILFLLWNNLRRSRKNVVDLLSLNRQVEEKNQQTMETLKALEESHHENTRIMKMVAHDLRNPVGGITALSDIMLSETHYSQEDRSMLEMIRSSGQSSLDLINDLLQFTVKQELKKEPVDLQELLKYCVDMLQLKASEKRQEIILQTTSLSLSINREKIWRVFSNLVSNAIKFSPTGTQINISTDIQADYVITTIKDQGIGIPEELKDKIFDMLTDAKRTGTNGEQTFGMGLAIAKQIVEGHSGTIWCESKTNEGTTFFVKLPKD